MKFDYPNQIQPDGWVRTADRKPTKADRNNIGQVVVVWFGKHTRRGDVHTADGWRVRAIPDEYPLWAPIPNGPWRKDLKEDQTPR